MKKPLQGPFLCVHKSSFILCKYIVYRTFNTFNMNVLYVIFHVCFSFFWHLHYWIFHTTLECSMQHATSIFNTFNIVYPGSCKKLLFHISFFGKKVYLIFLIIDLWSDLKLICILNYMTYLPNSCPGLPGLTLWRLPIHFHGQLVIKFH